MKKSKSQLSGHFTLQETRSAPSNQRAIPESMLLIPLLSRGPFVGNGNLAVMCADIAEEHGAQHESVSLGNTVPLVSLEQILHQEGLPFPYIRGLIDCGFQQGIQVVHKQISSIFVIVLIIDIVILIVQNIDILGQKIRRVNRLGAL